MSTIKIVIGSWGSYSACNSRALGSSPIDLAAYSCWEQIEESLKKLALDRLLRRYGELPVCVACRDEVVFQGIQRHRLVTRIVPLLHPGYSLQIPEHDRTDAEYAAIKVAELRSHGTKRVCKLHIEHIVLPDAELIFLQQTKFRRLFQFASFHTKNFPQCNDFFFRWYRNLCAAAGYRDPRAH